MVEQKLSEAIDRVKKFSMGENVLFSDCGEWKDKKQILYEIIFFCHACNKKATRRVSRVGNYKKICYNCRVKSQKKQNEKRRKILTRGKRKL